MALIFNACFMMWKMSVDMEETIDAYISLKHIKAGRKYKEAWQNQLKNAKKSALVKRPTSFQTALYTGCFYFFSVTAIQISQL